MAEVVALQGEFDLDPEIEARCEERLALARTHMAAGFYHWLEAGRLHKANKTDLGSRKWSPWCETHNISRQGADLLIRIAERFGSIPPIDGGIEIDFTALEALASPTAPIAAAEEAVKRAASGDRITKAEAQKLIAKARHEAEIEAAEAAQARFSEELERAAEELRENELLVAGRDREIAELKLAVATAIQTERDRQAVELEGKVVVPEAELQETVERLMEPLRAQLDKTEAARAKAIEQRNAANARLKTLREQHAEQAKAAAARAGKPAQPPLDSTLSFNSLVTRQAIEHCLRDLKVTPADMIRIEIEFSTRLHDNPGLARDKLDQVAAAIGELLPWFELFLRLHAKEYPK